ncbi:hypothetical protein CBI38_09760 [Rhodococcus oxybenzonivorans]|uniref:Uncharacterized protein n=1 Tax=Rhodococcus oxybenzonivorans TaxID=1990687 RepID=A0A2S2BTC5_9NOCA|nr:hypothetical protein CBI38_09760 [Rhodococcus oxybenzonivorans]
MPSLGACAVMEARRLLEQASEVQGVGIQCRPAFDMVHDWVEHGEYKPEGYLQGAAASVECMRLCPSRLGLVAMWRALWRFGATSKVSFPAMVFLQLPASPAALAGMLLSSRCAGRGG